MEWPSLLNSKRLKEDIEKDTNDNRSEYQRDIDRIIFSSPFRRLQNKTQVFPLPSNDFVHTRLTHSLEVAMVGRTLGMLGGDFILNEKEISLKKEYKPDDFSNIVVAACLAHDLGNPPFGHSGEKAISHFFIQDSGKKYISSFTEAQKNDVKKFEGNAAGLRLLTNEHPSGISGGLRLSYAMLGCFIKYPTDSISKDQHNDLLTDIGKSIPRKSLEKFGYFQSEKEIFNDICNNCGLIKLSSSNESTTYARHPLTFLMEAADTICFKLIDLEDGHKVRLIPTDKTCDVLNQIIESNNANNNKRKLDRINLIKDPDEKVAALRARALNVLIYQCIDVFKENYDKIMNAQYDKELAEDITSKKLLLTIKDICKNHLYEKKSVVELELAGYKVMGGLLDYFISAVLTETPKEHKFEKIILLLPKEFRSTPRDNGYLKIMRILDYVSRMTDSYAVDLYRKINGIELPFY